MVTVLNFEFSSGASWKTGRFEFDDLCIVGSGDNLRVKYDNIKLYLDGKLYEGGIACWATNSMTTDELFNSVLSSYLRENHAEYNSFDKQWSESFKEIEALKEKKDGLMIKMPVYDYIVKMYELSLATPDYKFYNYYDEYQMLGADGEIITDYENFWFQGFGEELAAIFQDKTTSLYMSDDTKTLIEEYGGKEYFIETYAADADPDI